VKILDFGLARPSAAATSPEDTRSPTVTSRTQPGTVLGTMGYMSPEQVRGEPVDARSDIFSFGAVFYEMLSGRRAFQGGSQAETMAAILQSDPPESDGSGKALPPGVDRVLRRCLEKKPEQRFQSASDLAFALDSLSAVSGPGEMQSIGGGSTTRHPWAARSFLWAALGAILSGVVVFLALGPARRSRPAVPTPPVRFTIAPPTGAMVQGMLALSPDGRRLAFVATTSDGRDLLFLRSLDALETHPVEGTEGASFPFWSPDSRSIAFFAHDKLKRFEAGGGSVQILCDAPTPRGGSWSTAGAILFSVNNGGELHRVSAGGGNPVALPALSAKGPYNSYRFPNFLPDGRHFVYFGSAGGFAVFLGSLDSPGATRLVAADGGGLYAAPGFLLYLSGGRLMGQRFDAEHLKLFGEPFPVVDRVWWDPAATAAIAVSASDNGLLACQTGGLLASRLLWYDREGRELGPLGSDSAYWEPTISPDDHWLVAPRTDPEKQSSDLWLFDLERGGQSRLTSEESVPTTPLWSGDARRIVYSGFTGVVHGRDVHGAEGEKLLFRQPSFTPLDDLSRDGRLLFYEALDVKRNHLDVWMRDMQTGASRPMLEAAFNQSGARLSPDGHWLAYESDESGRSEICVRSFPGAGERRQISQGGGQQARWRKDGKELFYVSPDRKIVSVEIRPGTTLEAGTPRPLFQTRIRPQIEVRNHYDVTSDGQRFIVNSYRPEDAALPITVMSSWMPAGTK